MNNDEKNKLYGIMFNIYNYCSNLKIWILCCVLIFVLILFDLSSREYISPIIEKIFTYDIGNAVAITVVIWTFTVTLSVYYLGKMEDRCFGIRMIDVLISAYKPKKLFILGTIILSELFVLIIAAIGELEITITGIVLLQFFTMTYMFLLVCLETSRSTVKIRIKGQLSAVSGAEIENLLLINMINNLNYNSKDDCNALLEVLKSLPSGAEAAAGKKIAEYIVDAGSESIVWNIIKQWLVELEESSDLRKGIVMAMVEGLSPKTFPIFLGILDSIENERDAKELYIWFVVYNMHLSHSEGQSWRVFFNEKIRRYVLHNCNGHEVRKAIEFMKIFNKDSNNISLRDIYEIFPVEALE